MNKLSSKSTTEKTDLIFKTRDYAIFKTIGGNRNINSGHLTRLASSILKHNLLEQNPIIVNEEFEVIDGQHRLEIARNNALEISYVVKQGATLMDVQLLNANIRQWQMSDYLQSYVEQGNPDYIAIKQLVDDYGLSIANALFLLNLGDMTGIRHVFRTGQFKVEAEKLKHAQAVAGFLNQLRDFLENDFSKDRSFVRAVLMVFDKFDTQRLIEKLVETDKKLGRRLNVREYLRQMEDIYNYKVREENRIRFY